MNLTEHQRDVLEILFRANPDGSFVDMDQLLERTKNRTSKESMQFTLRSLIAKQLIMKHPRVRRRNRSRIVYSPTTEAYARLREEMTRSHAALAAIFESTV
jgi:predicted transcriptional regulator